MSCAQQSCCQCIVAVCGWRESARHLTAGAWVSVKLDVLRSNREREPELTLFGPRPGAKSPAGAGAVERTQGRCGNRLGGGDGQPE
jgi:hypothetical protein